MRVECSGARLQVFTARYRLKFLQLTDVFLASSLVPAYTVAAFAKRFARLALTAPPSGALICIGFIHNLLRRHPSCTCLLHQPHAGGTTTTGLPGPEPAPSGAARDAAAADGGDHGQRPAPGGGGGGAGADVYDAAAEDPAESRAVESSLWELAALRCHQDPDVRALLMPCCSSSCWTLLQVVYSCFCCGHGTLIGSCAPCA